MRSRIILRRRCPLYRGKQNLLLRAIVNEDELLLRLLLCPPELRSRVLGLFQVPLLFLLDQLFSEFLHLGFVPRDFEGDVVVIVNIVAEAIFLVSGIQMVLVLFFDSLCELSFGLIAILEQSFEILLDHVDGIKCLSHFEGPLVNIKFHDVNLIILLLTILKDEYSSTRRDTFGFSILFNQLAEVDLFLAQSVGLEYVDQILREVHRNEQSLLSDFGCRCHTSSSDLTGLIIHPCLFLLFRVRNNRVVKVLITLVLATQVDFPLMKIRQNQKLICLIDLIILDDVDQLVKLFHGYWHACLHGLFEFLLLLKVENVFVHVEDLVFSEIPIIVLV